ncbi:MAG: hypothetical protein PQJ50_17830 [Spirochaetales bacterium]|nr:hypothetical protein [Spirochaetales bacterium]
MDMGIEDVQLLWMDKDRAIQELKEVTESWLRDRKEKERAEAKRKAREERALLPWYMAVQVDVFA